MVNTLMPEFKHATCRGCYALGTACGDCERCTWELGNLRPMAFTQPAVTTLLTLQTIIQQAISRNERWLNHGQWSPSEWCCAVAGEVGEACNAATKLKRITDAIANVSDRTITDAEEAKRVIGLELADAILYAILAAQSVGRDLEADIIAQFNKKSEQLGFPERL